MARKTVSAWQQRHARRGQKSLMRLIAGQDEEIQRAILEAAKQAERQIALLPGEGVGAAVREYQYQQMRASLLSLADDLWGDQLAAIITENATTAAQLAANNSKDILSIIGRGLKPGQANLLMASMQSSATSTFDNLVSRMVNDINLSPNVFNAEAYMTGKIDDIVNKGILLGQSADEIAKNVTQFINPNVSGGVKYAAHRLGRTELNNAYHETSIRSYQESPYVDGVKWNLSGSHPTPDVCNEYATETSFKLGEGVYPPDSVPAKPHPNCFCYLTPITPDPDEFVNRMLNGDYDCSVVNA